MTGEQAMNSKYIVLGLVLILVSYNICFAGDLSNIRGVGMARTINTASRGTDAIGINPANLAIPEINGFTFSIAPTGFKLSTELFAYDIYTEYFTGVPGPNGERVAKHLDDADKEKILSPMPNLPRTRFNIESQIFAISYQNPLIGGIGFGIIEHIGSTATLSKDYFRMLAFGLEPSGSVYSFGGTNLSAWWYREYNISYGRYLPVKIPFLRDLYGGVAIKFIRGYGIYQTDHNNTFFGNYADPNDPSQYSLKGNFDFLTTHAGADFFNENSKASFSIAPDPVGKGTGFDIGVSGELINKVRVSASVTDIGSITWNKNVIQSTGGRSVDVQGVFGDMEDTLKDAMKGSSHPGNSFKTSLPTALRLGVALEANKFFALKFIPGHLLLAFDYLQGFNGSLGNTKKARFSLGAEYRIIPYVPIRTGLAFGGDDSVRWAFGLGFNSRYFNFDIATEHFGMFFIPKSFQAVSFSLGMKVKV
jgi:hypothetical protein